MEEVTMLKRMSDMAAATIGVEASGDVDGDDFEDVVALVLRRQIAGAQHAPSSSPGQLRGSSVAELQAVKHWVAAGGRS
jgi:hypothetical protein